MGWTRNYPVILYAIGTKQDSLPCSQQDCGPPCFRRFPVFPPLKRAVPSSFRRTLNFVLFHLNGWIPLCHASTEPHILSHSDSTQGWRSVNIIFRCRHASPGLQIVICSATLCYIDPMLCLGVHCIFRAGLTASQLCMKL